VSLKLQSSKKLQQPRFRRNDLKKRILDLLISIPAFLLSAPLMVTTAILLHWSLGKGIFFCQERPGLHGKPFVIYKFRTMRDSRDAKGHLLPDSERLTCLGRLLRSTSLDELPELFNVLSGDMSVVGPRPLLMQYLDRYSPEQMRRHDVKPGITGWAQVNGRNAITWEEKFKLDVWYVDHQSIWLDLEIIALTLLKVLKREGISHTGHATMEEFWGTQRRAEN
jgi:sugar transferase EpsL